jgi:hypothetical protein
MASGLSHHPRNGGISPVGMRPLEGPVPGTRRAILLGVVNRLLMGLGAGHVVTMNELLVGYGRVSTEQVSVTTTSTSTTA